MNKNSGTSKLIMPTFGPGMLLQHDDLELLGNYPRELSRLLFRSFFGCGVVCGLTVKAEPACEKLKVTVECGVALTCSGDPIPVSGSLELWADIPDDKSPFWVVLCRDTKHVGARTPMCDTDGESSATMCTREVDTYEVKITKKLDGECGCPEPPPTAQMQGATRGEGVTAELDCHKHHKEGKCGCDCSDCAACVVLTKVVYRDSPQGLGKWMVDHSARRFIRPVLLPDMQAAADKASLADPINPNTSPAQPLPAMKEDLLRLEEEIQKQFRKEIKAQETRQLRLRKQIDEQREILKRLETFSAVSAGDPQEVTADDANTTT